MACGNLGDAPILSRPVIRPHIRGVLLEDCAPVGCARIKLAYALTWRERGIEIIFFASGLEESKVLAIARSTAVVYA